MKIHDENLRYILVLTEQGLWEMRPFAGEGGCLKQLQEAVGGLIDMISVDRGVDMVVNDEFLDNGSGQNLKASVCAEQAIMGTVVFVGVDESTGTTLGFTKGEALDVTLYVENKVARFMQERMMDEDGERGDEDCE